MRLASPRRERASVAVESNGLNGSRSAVLGMAAALGIATVTGVVGWTFANVVGAASALEHLKARQESLVEHNAWIDKQLDEANKRLRDLEMWQYQNNYLNKTRPPT